MAGYTLPQPLWYVLSKIPINQPGLPVLLLIGLIVAYFVIFQWLFRMKQAK